MTVEVLWPPNEKVKLLGRFSRPEVIGLGVAVAVFTGGIATSHLPEAATVVAVVLGWTFARRHGRPLRVQTAAWLRWLGRRDKVWSAPLRGRTGQAPSCLRGITLRLATDPGQREAVAVIETRTGGFTVVMQVDGMSQVFASSAAQSQRFDDWGEVLGGLCVEAGTALTAERVAWTDVHRASDPATLVSHHRRHGVDGPATADYGEYLSEFGSVASSHRVLVSATVTRAGRLRLARQHGFTGSVREVMIAAAVAAGRFVADDLVRHGYTVSALLSPAEVARVIVDAGDPYTPPREQPSAAERFGMPERTGPNHLHVDRHHVAIDGAYHRAFIVEWPRTRVGADWCWKPLGVDGPKIVTAVFEALAPSVADSRREATTQRGRANNKIVAAQRGTVRTTDLRKVEALQAAEAAVSAGHQELDGYAIVVVTGRSVEDLARRCQLLRQKLREAGRAEARELTGEHDFGFAAALPLGVWVRPAVE